MACSMNSAPGDRVVRAVAEEMDVVVAPTTSSVPTTPRATRRTFTGNRTMLSHPCLDQQRLNARVAAQGSKLRILGQPDHLRTVGFH